MSSTGKTPEDPSPGYSLPEAVGAAAAEAAAAAEVAAAVEAAAAAEAVEDALGSSSGAAGAAAAGALRGARGCVIEQTGLEPGPVISATMWFCGADDVDALGLGLAQDGRLRSLRVT
jgi:hypothetical protein